MVFSAVAWNYKDVITSAKLAQMVENLRVHDHRGDGTQGDGTPEAQAPVGPNLTTGVTTYARRAGTVSLNISLTASAALASGAVLCTLPAGYRPATAWFGTLVNNSAGTVLRVHVNTDGTVAAQAAIASGNLIRGSVSFAVA